MYISRTLVNDENIGGRESFFLIFSFIWQNASDFLFLLCEKLSICFCTHLMVLGVQKTVAPCNTLMANSRC